MENISLSRCNCKTGICYSISMHMSRPGLLQKSQLSLNPLDMQPFFWRSFITPHSHIPVLHFLKHSGQDNKRRRLTVFPKPKRCVQTQMNSGQFWMTAKKPWLVVACPVCAVQSHEMRGPLHLHEALSFHLPEHLQALKKPSLGERQELLSTAHILNQKIPIFWGQNLSYN